MNDTTHIDFKKEYWRLLELPLMVISIFYFVLMMVFRESVRNFLRANGEFPFIIMILLAFMAFVVIIHFVGKKLMLGFCLKKQFSRQQLDHYNRIAKIVYVIAMITMMAWLFVLNFFG